MSPEKYLKYLAETDIEYGKAKAHVSGLEYRMKVMESVAYLKADGKTQEDKKAQAKTSPEYLALLADYEDASMTLHTIGSKRKTAELAIEVWRTIEASRRKGNI